MGKPILGKVMGLGTPILLVLVVFEGLQVFTTSTLALECRL